MLTVTLDGELQGVLRTIADDLNLTPEETARLLLESSLLLTLDR